VCVFEKQVVEWDEEDLLINELAALETLAWA